MHFTKNREICSGDKVADWLKPCFKYFATVYLDIIKKQSGKAEEIRKEFFGLRDFYRLDTHMIMFAIHSRS